MNNSSNNWAIIVVALIGLIGVIITAILARESGERAAIEVAIAATMTAETKNATPPTVIPTELPLFATLLPELPTPIDISDQTLVPTENQPVSSKLTIEWGILEAYFNISQVHIEKQKFKDPLGKIYEADVLAFTVETKTDFLIAVFFAHFYDSEKIEVTTFSPLQFTPDYSASSWQAGSRSRAVVLLPLPEEMQKVRLIQFTQL